MTLKFEIPFPAKFTNEQITEIEDEAALTKQMQDVEESTALLLMEDPSAYEDMLARGELENEEI